MLNFFKRILGRNESATAVLEPNEKAAPAAAVARPAPKAAGGVEVASLSLRVILEKLPADLKAIVNQFPDADAKIVLPVSTIMKQLAGGAVKMSLASLIRQAPPGTFRKVEIEDKRMVDVPLSEVFKTVSPSRLQRRAGQRQYDVPDDATGLFGQRVETRSLADASAGAPAARTGAHSEPTPPAAPSAPPPAPAVPDSAPVAEAPKAGEAKPEPMKVIRMPGFSPAPAPASTDAGSRSVVQPKVAASAPKPAAHPGIHGELSLSFVEVASGWPEGIRGELSILPGDTKLVIPASAVAPGLQLGKVAFPWSQVRVWIRPSFNDAVSIPDDFLLILPLKIVAPAFVAATGATRRDSGVVADQSLPDFFGPAAKKVAQPEAAKPAPEAAAPEAVAPPEPPAAVSMPQPGGGLKLSIASEKPQEVEVSPAVPAAPAPAPAEAKLSPVAGTVRSSEPKTVGELLGQPDRQTWTPADLIALVCDLPGVAGAVVALAEGLVVAQKLPEGFAAETFAAFMPQFFGRVEGYVQEMKLGAADEITIHSSVGPCHIARSGKVFFAALGRAGEKLPAGLNLIPAELASQNH
jgi:predicted regulator of Ras-like GTPase activity (Roadblock/LC7/MglB family)